MKKPALLLALILLSFKCVFADTVTINHFVVKENPFAKDEVAIVATDTAENVREKVNGSFQFTINGFDDTLRFDKGTAFYRKKLDHSIFLYVKHVNEQGTHSLLYYVYKHDNKLSPVHISWILLLLIPVVLILLVYVFKRFFILAIIIFLAFLYFNHHSGLDIHTFFESIIDGLKNLFK